jgi:hypothetical protein
VTSVSGRSCSVGWAGIHSTYRDGDHLCADDSVEAVQLVAADLGWLVAAGEGRAEGDVGRTGGAELVAAPRAGVQAPFAELGAVLQALHRRVLAIPFGVAPGLHVCRGTSMTSEALCPVTDHAIHRLT